MIHNTYIHDIVELLSDIFQPQFSSLRALREKEDEAYSYFLDFVDECGSSGRK